MHLFILSISSSQSVFFNIHPGHLSVSPLIDITGTLTCYVLRVLLCASLYASEFCSPCTSGLLSWCDALEL